eukprot:6209894-Pleurochrysis_carterae.AAC.1
MVANGDDGNMAPLPARDAFDMLPENKSSSSSTRGTGRLGPGRPCETYATPYSATTQATTRLHAVQAMARVWRVAYALHGLESGRLPSQDVRTRARHWAKNFNRIGSELAAPVSGKAAS